MEKQFFLRRSSSEIRSGGLFGWPICADLLLLVVLLAVRCSPTITRFSHAEIGARVGGDLLLPATAREAPARRRAERSQAAGSRDGRDMKCWPNQLTSESSALEPNSSGSPRGLPALPASCQRATRQLGRPSRLAARSRQSDDSQLALSVATLSHWRETRSTAV